MADGGKVVGKSHSEGGEKFSIAGRVVELEGDEGVINKRSMSSNKTYSVKGTPAKIASCINELEGGVKFESGNCDIKRIMTLDEAKSEALNNSKEGYVQHVNKTSNGYEVSDWYDSESTVASYEDGERLMKNGGKVSDKIKLLKKEGYPQDQAVAIALNMDKRGKLEDGGKVRLSRKDKLNYLEKYFTIHNDIQYSYYSKKEIDKYKKLGYKNFVMIPKSDEIADIVSYTKVSQWAQDLYQFAYNMYPDVKFNDNELSRLDRQELSDGGKTRESDPEDNIGHYILLTNEAKTWRSLYKAFKKEELLNGMTIASGVLCHTLADYEDYLKERYPGINVQREVERSLHLEDARFFEGMKDGGKTKRSDSERAGRLKEHQRIERQTTVPESKIKGAYKLLREKYTHEDLASLYNREKALKEISDLFDIERIQSLIVINSYRSDLSIDNAYKAVNTFVKNQNKMKELTLSKSEKEVLLKALNEHKDSLYDMGPIERSITTDKVNNIIEDLNLSIKNFNPTISDKEVITQSLNEYAGAHGAMVEVDSVLGMIDGGGVKASAEDTWNGWSVDEKQKFLNDTEDFIYRDDLTVDGLEDDYVDYDDLPREVMRALEEYVDGKMGDGGVAKKKYELGDMWSSDFDYKGMLKYGTIVDSSWSTDDLQKLFDSYEDVNYHWIAAPLHIGILRVEGDKTTPDYYDEEPEYKTSEQAFTEFRRRSKNELSKLSKETTSNNLSLTQVIDFMNNVKQDFIEEAWKEDPMTVDRLNGELDNYVKSSKERFRSRCVIGKFMTELDHDNRKILEDYVIKNH